MKLVKCWDQCRNVVTHEWSNSKGDSFYLCDDHFERLALVHDYEIIEQGQITKVKVLPMPEVNNA